MTTSPEWLQLRVEAPIEPDLPIIDPHHHFWDRDGSRYFLPELVADVAGQNVRQTVFVECVWAYRTDGPSELRVVGETEFVEGLARQSANGATGDLRSAAGIVGTADLTLGGAVVPVLEAHLAASPSRFRGIRHRAAWVDHADAPGRQGDTPKGILLDAKFRTGFAQLAKHNLTFDAWLYHPQITELTDLARAFPETTIVLNHLGGPLGIGTFAGKRAEIFAQWKIDIAEIAKLPNVVMKVGGIQMTMNGFGWHERPMPPSSEELLAENRPWYMYVIEQFGADRCMFESNFPPDRLSCSYTVLWNQFKLLTKEFTATERAALFHDTALRVYRLERH